MKTNESSELKSAKLESLRDLGCVPPPNPAPQGLTLQLTGSQSGMMSLTTCKGPPSLGTSRHIPRAVLRE